MQHPHPGVVQAGVAGDSLPSTHEVLRVLAGPASQLQDPLPSQVKNKNLIPKPSSFRQSDIFLEPFEDLIEEEVCVSQASVNEHFEEMKAARGLFSDTELEQRRKMTPEEVKHEEFQSAIESGELNGRELSEKELLRDGLREKNEIRKAAEKEYIQRKALEQNGYDPDNPKNRKMRP